MSDLIEKALRHMNDPHARYSMKDRFDHAQLFTDEIERLTGEVDSYRTDYEECYNDLLSETLRANTAEAQIDKLQAVVTRYAEHDAECTCEDQMNSGDIFYRNDLPCSCGYREAVAALEDIHYS